MKWLSRLQFWILPLFCTGAFAADTFTVKLASKARLDIVGDAHTMALNDVKLLSEGGTSERMRWLKAEEQNNSLSASFDLSRFSTNEFSFQFTPANSGNITVDLLGPWEAESKTKYYRQDVEWISFSLRGGKVVGKSFGELPKPVRVWHNQRSHLTFAVEGGTPVVIQCSALPVLPDGFKDMPRISGRDTPAYQAARKFKRGANLGNYLEVPPGQNWGAKISAEDIAHIRKEGFDHIRLPVGWHHYAGPAPDYKLSGTIYAKADFVVTNALNNGLSIIVNIHHFDDFTTDPEAQKEKFYALWRQIAAHYASYPDSVALELLNEPKDAATTAVINPIFAEAIRQIRQIDPKRTIFVGPGRWNSIPELNNLVLPDDDNLIVTVHCYDPFYFTHQGATWAGPDTKVQGIRFPGPPSEPLAPDPALKVNPWVADWIKQYNTLPTEQNPSSSIAFRKSLKFAGEWSEYYGRPVHVGEFGCFTKADATSRLNFYEAFRKTAESHHLAWAIWDWNGGFNYWDTGKNEAIPGMRQALFGH